MRTSTIPCLLAATFLAAPAFAQTQAAPAPAPAPAQTAAPVAAAAPAPAATAAAQAAVSDEEVSKFASAALAVDKLQKDATIADADKQAKMASAVQVAGLEPKRFNAIAQAVQTDTALKARVTAEFARQQTPPK